MDELGEEIRQNIKEYFGKKVEFNKHLIRSYQNGRRAWVDYKWSSKTLSGIVIGVRYIKNGRVEWMGEVGYIFIEDETVPCLLIAHHPYQNHYKVPLGGIVSIE